MATTTMDLRLPTAARDVRKPVRDSASRETHERDAGPWLMLAGLGAFFLALGGAAYVSMISF